MSEAGRTWALRLLALGIAIGIWANVSLEERQELSEKLVEASVSYNRPRGFVILDPVQNVLVRLRGSSKAIRNLNPNMVDVQVELTQAQPGTAAVNLGPDNILMPEDLELVSIEPNAIRVELDREITQRVAVEPKLEGEPAAGVKVGTPEVFPNQILVTGPESLLRRLETLASQPISLEGRAATFEETVGVVSPNPLIQVIQPSRVTVRIPMTPPETAAQQPARAPARQKGT